jgi:hypothetical protein
MDVTSLKNRNKTKIIIKNGNQKIVRAKEQAEEDQAKICG